MHVWVVLESDATGKGGLAGWCIHWTGGVEENGLCRLGLLNEQTQQMTLGRIVFTLSNQNPRRWLVLEA